MRRTLTALVVAAVVALPAAAAEKDTPAAEETRKVLKTVKISVDYNKEYLRNIFVDVTKQVKGSETGKLEFTKTPGTGVNLNTKIDLKLENVPVVEVLDAVCKGRGFGYVVVSKAGDKDDGKILWTVGDERGYPADSGVAAKPTKKETTPEPTKKETTPATGDAEAKAASKLALAKDLLADGKKDKAIERLEAIVKEFPGTKAAAEAADLLKKK